MIPERNEIDDHLKRGIIEHLTAPKPAGHGAVARRDANSDLTDIRYEGLMAMHGLEHEHFEHGHEHLDTLT